MYFLKVSHLTGTNTPVEHYILIGRRLDGVWVKYFDTEDLCKQYFGKSENVSIQKITTNGSTIIANHARCNNLPYGSGTFYAPKADEFGEFHFKWDERVQWFSIEKITNQNNDDVKSSFNYLEEVRYIATNIARPYSIRNGMSQQELDKVLLNLPKYWKREERGNPQNIDGRLHLNYFYNIDNPDQNYISAMLQIMITDKIVDGINIVFFTDDRVKASKMFDETFQILKRQLGNKYELYQDKYSISLYWVNPVGNALMYLFHIGLLDNKSDVLNDPHFEWNDSDFDYRFSISIDTKNTYEGF